MLNSELELKVRDYSLRLKASGDILADRTLQLEASERNLVKLTLRLEASDNHVAELSRQLKASENDLTTSILRLKISDGQLTDSTLQLDACETRKQVVEDEREELISQLNKALSGKTILMKELHHRVKNNLAVIASLLNMQAAMMNDEAATRALRDSQQRVLSMALIHESLYGSEQMDKLNFREYLERLVGQVHAAYAVEADLVSITVAAEDIDLPMHRVISCGLIVNELLSNALKYAYPLGQAGEIRIRFYRLESGALVLSCEDNGAGIPESLDWENSPTLGLRIIQLLAQQLDGKLKLDRRGGTKFELVFLDHSKDPELT